MLHRARPTAAGARDPNRVLPTWSSLCGDAAPSEPLTERPSWVPTASRAKTPRTRSSCPNQAARRARRCPGVEGPRAAWSTSVAQTRASADRGRTGPSFSGREAERSNLPVIMIGMPMAEIYTVLLAGLLVGGVLWVVTRFTDRD